MSVRERRRESAVPVSAQEKPVKKVHYKDGRKPDKPSLISGTVSYGNLLFIAGVGAHVPGDIKSHTKIVLDQIHRGLAGGQRRVVLGVEVARVAQLQVPSQIRFLEFRRPATPILSGN